MISYYIAQEPSLVPCDDLEDGGRSGRKAQEGGNI